MSMSQACARKLTALPSLAIRQACEFHAAHSGRRSPNMICRCVQSSVVRHGSCCASEASQVYRRLTPTSQVPPAGGLGHPPKVPAIPPAPKACPAPRAPWWEPPGKGGGNRMLMVDTTLSPSSTRPMPAPRQHLGLVLKVADARSVSCVAMGTHSCHEQACQAGFVVASSAYGSLVIWQKRLLVSKGPAAALAWAAEAGQASCACINGCLCTAAKSRLALPHQQLLLHTSLKCRSTAISPARWQAIKSEREGTRFFPDHYGPCLT